MPPNRQPYKIIFSSGVSIVRNLKDRFPDLPTQNEINYLTTDQIDSLGSSKFELSAELSLMNALGVGPRDAAVLLTTNTELGKKAAAIVRHVAGKVWNGIEVEVVETAVKLNDADAFKRFGLPDFMAKLDDVVSKSDGFEPIIGVSAGTNHVLPYLTIYGMLRRLTCAYVYEPRRDTRGKRLVRLPRLPLSFDYEALRVGADAFGALQVLDRIEEDTCIPTAELKKKLKHYYDTLEGLFEPIGQDQVTLGAFAYLLNDFRRATNTRIWLSRRAGKTLGKLNGIQKKSVESMLAEARIPLWRQSSIHPLTGVDTDLDVYKDSRSIRRIAGWADGDGFYVAEIFINSRQYQSYVRMIGGKKRSDYRTSDFVEFGGGITTILRSDEDKESAELAAVEKLERDYDVLSERNKELEDQNRDLYGHKEQIESKFSALSSKLRAVEAERDMAVAVEREFSEMRLTRRLRWCLTGRR